MGKYANGKIKKALLERLLSTDKYYLYFSSNFVTYVIIFNTYGFNTYGLDFVCLHAVDTFKILRENV